MTPTPPEGFKIIPQAYLEAGNPLPEDAIVWNGVLKCWIEAELVGCPAGAIRPYATAQPLPCFAVPSPDQGLAKLAYEQGGEPRTECPACAGEPCDHCALKLAEQRIAELEREIEILQRNLAGAVDNEQERWQDALDNLFARLLPDASLDGGGCDSGDPLDFSIAEISQAIQHIESKAESELAKLRATIETLTRERDEARAENSQLTAALNSSSRTMELAGKEIDYLCAQLAASEKDRQWQPIETAPKDGTVVFICNEAAYPCSVEAAASHLGKWWHGESVEYDYEPTHWMPLPKAPDAAMKEAK